MAVTLAEAMEILNIKSNASFLLGRNYKPFLKRPKGSRTWYFDIFEYRKREALKSQIIANTGLLIEYLLHIEGFTGRYIADSAKVTSSVVFQHKIGIKAAMKIIKFMNEHHSDVMDRFDNYYGFSNKWRMTDV